MSRARLDLSERGPEVTRLRRLVARALDAGGVIAPGEHVLVACSGGADSTAMLDCLARLAPPRHLDLHVAHVDHGLRPGGADEALGVATLCARLGLPFRALRVEVGEGPSLQDRARQARHAALRLEARRVGASAIALGHTADDQAETVLMRALSGASPRSLAAMGARDGALARPLLSAWREQPAAYCVERGLTVVDDPSNRDLRYLRSRVRHELLPALEIVFPAARRRLVTLAARQRAVRDSGPGGGAYDHRMTPVLERPGVRGPDAMLRP